MADVRALLAAERQSRRITHPHLTYTKSGMLICTTCNMNVKSEALWEGHLKSANHRKNAHAQAQAHAASSQGQESNTKGTKRKIEDVDEPQDERDDAEIETRKKAKSRPESLVSETKGSAETATAAVTGGNVPKQAAAEEEVSNESEKRQKEPEATTSVPVPPSTKTEAPVATNGHGVTVDEDEWAAFEREVAPLAAAGSADSAQAVPDYSSATITAAPVTAEQLKRQSDEEKQRRLESAADDEKEDEERRLEEEFEVMEEMEERVRKLREKRDALRRATQAQAQAQQTGADEGKDGLSTVPLEETNDVNGEERGETTVEEQDQVQVRKEGEGEDEEDDDDVDDWYS